ncbi:MAG TPA: beta-galactosidase [Ktedonosporobacter sp.]|nr:beta-galactosidase [Ktedonosporobacter sp.]
MFTDHHLTREYSIDLRREAPPITSGHLRLGGTSPQGDTLAATNYYLTYNGHPSLPVMGEFHFSRFPRQYWLYELQKMRAGGITIVASYIFWIYVEEEEGVFDWSGDNDVRAFVEACQASGLQLLLRIGPFAHGECRNGGLPDWLYGRSFAVRSNDEPYLAYVERFYSEVAAQIKGLLFKDGGPIIGIQLENEYMHCGAPWEVTFKPGAEWVPAGTDGADHMLRLKEIALALDLDVPIYSCTGWIGSPVPEHEFLPMQGGYAFQPWSPDPEYRQPPTREFLFRDRHAQPLSQGEVTYNATEYPYACCELGGGIQITYHHRPIVPTECVQAMAIVALGSGANLLGYYMYHGGSNPIGKHAYLNEFTVPRISYDFQAPIREFGQLNQSYHSLRALHLFLRDFGEMLAPMAVFVPEEAEQITPEDTTSLRYSVRRKDEAGFLFLNNYQDHVTMHDQAGVSLRLELPAESLVIPQSHDLTLRQDLSAILPFNLSLGHGILLKYATAQLLTTLDIDDQASYVFFAPEGMSTEFALDRATYHSLEVTGGTLNEADGCSYIAMEPGLHCRIAITALNGTTIQLFVLTQAQAFSSWKVQQDGQDLLVLTEALVLAQDEQLHLYWRGQESLDLFTYPPLKPDAMAEGQLCAEQEGFFTHYALTVPEHTTGLQLQQLAADRLKVKIPAMALNGAPDAFLCIEYLGDTGHAYLDGRLVSDHFANGLPWEIGLKRFVSPDKEQELILHVSPLQENAAAHRYFPTGMAFRPAADGTALIETRSVTVLSEYHATLAQQPERKSL